MARSRNPLSKARVIGAGIKNPSRLAGRSSMGGRALGLPSTFLTIEARQAWETFRAELPWLMESDRAMMEICCHVRGRMITGELVGTTALSMYQACLSKIGATPADRSKIAMPDDGPAPDEFFN